MHLLVLGKNWSCYMHGTGPLAGIRIIELGSIGPGPFAAMVLADLGADVVRIERPGATSFPTNRHYSVLHRGRPSVTVDLKDESARAQVMGLVAAADGLIEGYRPGVAERLGFGPEDCWVCNPRLVYGRMTGWGQSGPLAQTAGHDINYIAVTGLLHAIGRQGTPPQVPLNLLGDYGGGGMLMVVGLLAAILEAQASGRGQVVHAAMVDGTSLLGANIYGALSSGEWLDERGVNRLDSGRPYYDVYETADGGFVAVGALEEQFYRNLVGELGLTHLLELDRFDPTTWPAIREAFRQTFLSRTRDEWDRRLGQIDVCVSPVLSLGEAASHPQIRARDTLIEVEDVLQPAPAPRFSRTPASRPSPVPVEQGSLDETLDRWLSVEDQRPFGTVGRART
jgi:alpha-methylacyl-CoA racemase